MDHFKERHASFCNVKTDEEVELTNINVKNDDRHFFLVAQSKLLFILTMKIDTLQKMAYWTVQHIGGKKVAHDHIYEIHITSKQNPRRKVVFIEHCFNDSIKADEVFRQGKCAVLPLETLVHFVKDKAMSFRFFIKRIPPGPKNNNGKNDNKPPGPNNGPGPKGPGPKGPKNQEHTKNKPNGPGPGPKGNKNKAQS